MRFDSQGTLDGMCGHYAVINALAACNVFRSYKQKQRIFLEVWNRCPELYEGMYFKSMRVVLDRLRKSGEIPSVLVSVPFARKTIRVKRDVEGYFGQLLVSTKVTCAIIQIQRASDDWEDHWIVVKPDGNRFAFIDSIGNGLEEIRKNGSSLTIGRQRDTRSLDSRWHIVRPREVFSFKSVEPTE